MGFFAWEASWGKVLTLDYLKRRGRVLTNRCFLCEEEEESIDHLLVHCSKAKVLWDLLLGLVGVRCVFPKSVRETFLSWRETFVGKNCKKAWMKAPLCIFWTIWLERNSIYFDNKDFSMQRMKSSFVCNLWSWTNLYMVDRPSSPTDFLNWLGCR